MSEIDDEARQRLAAALDRALRDAGEAEAATTAASAQSVRQSSELESLLEGAERMALRGRDLRAGLQEIRETLERGRLATLNAALEGTRLPEPTGKVLVALTDELRALVSRALETMEEHAARLSELERDREKWVLTVGPLVDGARAVDTALVRTRDCQRSELSALRELAAELRERLGVDPELGGLLAKARRELQGFEATLEELRSRGAVADAERLRAALLGEPERAKSQS